MTSFQLCVQKLLVTSDGDIGKIRRDREDQKSESQTTSCSSETESYDIASRVFVRIGTYWRTEKPLGNYQKKKLVRPVK